LSYIVAVSIRYSRISGDVSSRKLEMSHLDEYPHNVDPDLSGKNKKKEKVLFKDNDYQ
jgi:hypothetical protein